MALNARFPLSGLLVATALLGACGDDSEVTPDTGADVGVDATEDTTGDTSEDVGEDTTADTGDDVSEDTTPDTTEDTTPDTTEGCGELTFEGECDADMLRFCEDGAVVEIDCAGETDDSGAVLSCGLVSEEVGYDCISAPFAGGCGDVPLVGRCDGNVLEICESQATGAVDRTECASGEECVVAPNGHAECVTAGATGCGSVTFDGQCDGTVLSYCEDDELVVFDCANEGFECGATGATGDVDCVPGHQNVEIAPGVHEVSGVFQYERYVPTIEDGFVLPTTDSPVSTAPVRGAQVLVQSTADNTVVARGFTDNDGAFSLSFLNDDDVEVSVLLISVANPTTRPFTVRTCSSPECENTGETHAFETAAFMSNEGEATPIGTETIPVAEEAAGAFSVFDAFVRGMDFIQVNIGKPAPPVAGRWNEGLHSSTSYFSSADAQIVILGWEEDADQWDVGVLGHEFGHYMEHSFSRSDSPGGDHDGSKTDPRLAWGEGYGTFVGGAINDSATYIDTNWEGGSVTLLDVTTELADPDHRQGMRQAVAEGMVTQILWKIAYGFDGMDGAGTADIFDVMANYLPSDELADRGVEGVDLVDFLDGWVCRGHGERELITAVLEAHGFPYDFAGPESCTP